VRKDAKWKDWAELYEEAKKAPVNLGVATPKTYYHIAGVILNEAAGTKFNFIHYGGGGASRTALLQGEVPAVLTGLFSAANIFDRVRGILVFAPTNPIPDTFHMATSREVIPGKPFPEFLHPTTLFCSKELQKRYPDRFDYLVKTFREAVQAPKTKELAIKGGFPAVSWEYWSPERCKEYEKEFVARLQTLKIG
jgi:putative tricarboxylic transport membrane protein